MDVPGGFDPPLGGLASSFVEYLRTAHPNLLPVVQSVNGTEANLPAVGHATTVLALRYDHGIVMAGDRRATEGTAIASRTIEKIFPADSHSCVAIAGAAGPALEMVRIFQVELEHYEKIEGRRLSLEGKANRLAEMIRQNLLAALQGLAVVPIFAGYDVGRDTGRLFRYDLTGGRYEELDFAATGSGGRDARSYVKGRWQENLPEAEGVEIALEALFEASDEDVGTGGPDVIRGIYPNVAVVNAEGFREIPEDGIIEIFGSTLERLRERYGGHVR